jgi:aminoglycoside phosphotransferase (APT) family kinase protein
MQERLLRLAPRIVAGATGVEGVNRLSGGASQETWAFDVLAPQGRSRWVMRRNPAGAGERSELGCGLATEARLMELALAAGVPVPRVACVLVPDDGLGIGFVMTRVDGETIPRRILRDDAFASARPLLARQCGELAARIHGIDPSRLPPLRQAPARAELAAYLERHRSHRVARPVFELAFRWLEDHLPARAAEPRLVHGDFRHGNLMIGEAGVRAVLDWELAHLGDPMEDLGWICVNSWRFGNVDLPVGGFGTREELFAGYEAAGGGRVDPQAVRFWEVLGTLKWGVMCDGMAASFLSGRERNVERAAIGRRASETEIDLLGLLAPRQG